MDIALISFTRPGKALAKKLADALTVRGHNCRFAKFNDAGELFAQAHGDLCAEGQKKPAQRDGLDPGCDEAAGHGIIFVGATGIAVRAIAPHVKSKYRDPAVVVCDEQGLFSISLLSGHEGGANELAREAADILGAAPVITTASELKRLIAGCGCRRGVSAEQIEAAFMQAGVWPERIAKLCTIDIKRDEAGLIEFAEKYGIPVEFFTAEELMAVQGDFISGSEFVQKVTGADNVCERAAVLGGRKGRLVLPKQAAYGVTVAVFEAEREK